MPPTKVELFSWLSNCPVCGRDLTEDMAGNLACVVGHGTFTYINGNLIFNLNTEVAE